MNTNILNIPGLKGTNSAKLWGEIGQTVSQKPNYCHQTFKEVQSLEKIHSMIIVRALQRFSHLRRIQFLCISKINMSMKFSLEGFCTITNKLMVELIGGLSRFVSFCIFYENWWFRTKRFTGLWELIHVQLLWTIPIREIFHFHHLPKLYFGFNALSNLSKFHLQYMMYICTSKLVSCALHHDVTRLQKAICNIILFVRVSPWHQNLKLCLCWWWDESERQSQHIWQCLVKFAETLLLEIGKQCQSHPIHPYLG